MESELALLFLGADNFGSLAMLAVTPPLLTLFACLVWAIRSDGARAWAFAFLALWISGAFHVSGIDSGDAIGSTFGRLVPLLFYIGSCVFCEKALPRWVPYACWLAPMFFFALVHVVEPRFFFMAMSFFDAPIYVSSAVLLGRTTMSRSIMSRILLPVSFLVIAACIVLDQTTRGGHGPTYETVLLVIGAATMMAIAVLVTLMGRVVSRQQATSDRIWELLNVSEIAPQSVRDRE